MERLLSDLRALTKETEWIEFKVDKYEPQELGEYLSALSNAACLHSKERGYLVFGVHDGTCDVVGTHFKPSQKKVGNEELENWLVTQLNPRVDFKIHEFESSGKQIVIIEIDSANNIPVKFKGIAYIRVGSYKKKLSEHPEKERKIWKKGLKHDWSALICKNATIADLDKNAITKARIEFKQKNPKLVDDIDDWDDLTFLNKAKLTINGKITNTAIILLGKAESEHFISPCVAQLSWILQDENSVPKDYAHFGPPFILNVDNVLTKIRNLNYRYLPDRTLFPIEITQYDTWVIREALHNCIAHQDYEMHGRINAIEKPDELLFTNIGSFLPGSIEIVIQSDSPPEIYRNPFLAGAMVNLNMIDTIGSGIKKMYQKQKQRFFPMPDYNLNDPNRVEVRISGKIFDENYTRLLIKKTDLDLYTVILLDKVQKKTPLTKHEYQYLRKQGLVEGRYPNIYVSWSIASAIDKKAEYLKYRGVDDQHYQELVMAFIKKNKKATRKEINDILVDKLPAILGEEQKTTKIARLISKVMAKQNKLIKNIGSRKSPIWVALENREKD